MKKNGWRYLLSAILRGTVLLHLTSRDAHVSAREVEKYTDAKIWLMFKRQETEACFKGVLSACIGAFFDIILPSTLRNHQHLAPAAK